MVNKRKDLRLEELETAEELYYEEKNKIRKLKNSREKKSTRPRKKQKRIKNDKA